MSSDYVSGHEPTDVDENNALTYATMNQYRSVCLSDPVNYVWKDDPVLGYPCPEGLTCYSGKCEFTQQGCNNYSNLPVFDCKRKDVPCSFGSGTCSVCDWSIAPDPVIPDIPCPEVPPLTDADKTALGDQAVYCLPGDVKILPPGSYDPAPSKDNLCRPAQPFSCPGLPDTRVPYQVDGQKISCTCDDDCTLAPGSLGGNCFVEGSKGPEPLPEDSKCGGNDTGFCYPPDVPYTEWKKGFTAFNGAPAEDTCVVTFSQAKIWCEMPWTRPTTASSDGLSADPACWKTQYRQPFYYHEDDGKCYVTKSYCENVRSFGGFDGSYGDGHDFVVGSSCTTPQGTSNEIQSGYDCCTSLGQSFAQFFFGQTLPDEFDNIKAIAGLPADKVQAPNAYCTSIGATAAATAAPQSQAQATDSNRSQLEPIITFLSDERLKTNIELVEENGVGMGINVYRYEWSPEAKRLYKKPSGKVEGLLMKELEPVFPQCVRWSPYGHKMFAHVHDLMPKFPDVKSIIYLGVVMYLMASNDVLKED